MTFGSEFHLVYCAATGGQGALLVYLFQLYVFVLCVYSVGRGFSEKLLLLKVKRAVADI